MCSIRVGDGVLTASLDLKKLHAIARVAVIAGVCVFNAMERCSINLIANA